jgi:glutamine amidotransferase
MIAIIDYGMGNLRSVQKAFERVGADALITQSTRDIYNAKKIVLPGVGAMQPAMDTLKAIHMIDAIKDAVSTGKPFLGICLGFQLLFEKSHEGGDVRGLGIVEGEVKRFTDLKIPQIGWNQLSVQKKDCPLFKGIGGAADVYFCHSYFVSPRQKDIIASTTDYGIAFASAIWRKNLFGVQFHPEKSQTVGLQILKNFAEVVS